MRDGVQASKSPNFGPSVDHFLLADGLLEQPQIILDVRACRVFCLCGKQCGARPAEVAAQHVGEALVVQNFRRRTAEPNGLRVGAVGEIEAAQPIVGRSEPNPGLELFRMHSTALRKWRSASP